MSTFPQPWTSTVSHWQATNRGAQSLWNHGRGAALPFEADVVVVGAGMMGAALAYFLTLEDDLDVDKEGKHGKHGHKHKHKGKHVVVLDAKDCGSGASELTCMDRANIQRAGTADSELSRLRVEY
jgi:hypothetical protein